MKATFVLILFSFAIFNISCTHKDGVAQIIPVPKVVLPFVTHANLVYGPDSAQQSMDVFLPNNSDRQTTGVIVFIHGGGWTNGVKDDFNGLGLDTFFTNSNMAMVTINYRLIPAYPYPSALDDIGSVMQYIQNKADEWHINPNKVCLFARSSGAHLALQYAYTRNTDHRIKAVVDCFGPVNLTDTAVLSGLLDPALEIMLGTYATHQSAWHEASPIYHMDGAVPTIIMQGTADPLVLPSQSSMLNDSLIANGIPSLYLPWWDNGHGWNQQRWTESRDVTLAWLQHFM